MVVKIRSQEQARGDKAGEHHALVRFAAAAADAVQPQANQNGARAVEERVQRRKEGGMHLHQAAGLVVRRLATRNDSENITSVNNASTAKLTLSDRSVEADPGNSSERNASVP